MFLWLGKPRALVTPTSIACGDLFVFQYRQEIRRAVTVDLAAALVLREVMTVTRGDHAETTHRDRVIHRYEETALSLPAGETLRRDYDFRIPEDGARGYRVGDWPLRWVVKVHLRTHSGLELWEECEVPVTSTIGAEEPTGYDVVLVSGTVLHWRQITRVVSELLPHLDRAHVRELYLSAPVTLLRDVEQDRAEFARAELERAGAVVEVRLNDRIIDRAERSDLPIPQGVPPAPGELPIPADAGSPAGSDQSNSSTPTDRRAPGAKTGPAGN
jgi:hypothetical protein